MGEEGERSVPQGRIARIGRLGKLAAGLATDLAGAASRVAVGQGRDRASEAFHRSAAERLAGALGRMKGLPMKVGQMLSYIDDLIPAEYRDIYGQSLRRLQVKAHPMRWEEIATAVERDLGKSPDVLFRDFERTPIAAASIGQVYRAALADGTKVAVKVQYPGIADAIQNDLKNIDMLRSALALVLPKVDVERSLADITSRVQEECDYGCELNNQLEMRRIWEGDPDVLVPRVFPELCGDHVLTTELVDGHGWEAMRASSSPEAKSRFGRVLFRFVFRSLYGFGVFNGDPHPGNYIFPKDGDGKVAFLDYGCVQRFDEETIAAFRTVRKLAMAGVRGTPLREAMREGYGFPPDLDEEEWDFFEAYILRCFEPILAGGPFRFERAYTQRLYELTTQGAALATRKAVRKGIREAKRPGLVFLNRIQYGLYSILAELQTEAVWPDVIADVDRDLDARLAARSPA